MLKNSLFQFLSFLFGVAFLLSSCGGSETPVRGIPGSVRGELTAEDPQILKGIEVSLLSSGERGVVDADGSFQFEAHFSREEEFLLLHSEGRIAQVSLGSVPVGSFVFVRLGVDFSNDGFEVTINDLAIALTEDSDEFPAAED